MVQDPILGAHATTFEAAANICFVMPATKHDLRYPETPVAGQDRSTTLYA